MIPTGNNDKTERRRFRFRSILIQITIFSIFLFHHTTNKKAIICFTTVTVTVSKEY